MTYERPLTVNAEAIIDPYQEGSIEEFFENCDSRFIKSRDKRDGRLPVITLHQDIPNAQARHDFVSAQKRFVNDQVELLWVIQNEGLVPGSTSSETVYAGRWKKHPEDGLYVRVSADNVTLAKAGEERRNAGNWYNRCFGTRVEKIGSLFELQGGLSPGELVKASGLVYDFNQEVGSCMPFYA